MAGQNTYRVARCMKEIGDRREYKFFILEIPRILREDLKNRMPLRILNLHDSKLFN